MDREIKAKIRPSKEIVICTDPAMYEALREALVFVETHRGDSIRATSIINRVKAALAKGEGQEAK